MAPATVVFGANAAFLGGVLAASVGWSIVFVAAVLVLLGIVVSATRTIHGFKSWMVAAWFGALLFGFGYYHFFLHFVRSGERVPIGVETTVRAVVIREPERRERFTRLTVRLEPPFAGEVAILTGSAGAFRYGDLLQFAGSFTREDERRAPVALYPELEVISRGHGSPVRQHLLTLKETFVAQLRRFLPLDSAALLSGLTFGATGDFSDRFRDQMKASGTTHLVALSGYNILILVLAVYGTLGRLLSRRLTFWATSVIIILFVLMVGAEASVVRAAIMGFLALLAGEASRPYHFRNITALAAALMVLVDPALLRGDVGFELSFASLLGIAYLGAALQEVLPRVRYDPLQIRAHAITTLAAQLAVIPILLAVFGSFSLTAVLANILVLVVVPATMFLGFLLALLSLIASPLGVLLGFVANVSLAYMRGVIAAFAGFALPISADSAPWFAVIVYYGALLIFILWARERARIRAARRAA